MPYNNPVSLANLNRNGSQPGRKKAVTLKLIKTLNDYLIDNRELFETYMLELSPKDYCDMYLRMMKQLMPTKINLDVDQPLAAVNWVIQAASTVTDAATDSE